MKITPAWFTDARRRWAYRVAAAVSAVATGYGVVTAAHALLWLALAAVLFGVAQDNV